MTLFKETLPRYNGFLELHAERVYWRLRKPDNLSAAEFNALWLEASLEAKEEFEHETGEKVFLLGRSGRHVCVDDTKRNSKNYQHLRDKALKKLEWLISSVNSGSK